MQEGSLHVDAHPTWWLDTEQTRSTCVRGFRTLYRFIGISFKPIPGSLSPSTTRLRPFGRGTSRWLGRGARDSVCVARHGDAQRRGAPDGGADHGRLTWLGRSRHEEFFLFCFFSKLATSSVLATSSDGLHLVAMASNLVASLLLAGFWVGISFSVSAGLALQFGLQGSRHAEPR